MKPIINVFIFCLGRDDTTLYWNYGGARYHVRLQNDQVDPTSHLYKNPPSEQRNGKEYYLRHGDKGYFATRRLDTAKINNIIMIDRAMMIVREGDLITKAIASYEAEQARLTAQMQAHSDKQARAREIFSIMREVLRDGGPAAQFTIMPSDMEALLTYAPSEGDHN